MGRARVTGCRKREGLRVGGEKGRCECGEEARTISDFAPSPAASSEPNIRVFRISLIFQIIISKYGPIISLMTKYSNDRHVSKKRGSSLLSVVPIHNPSLTCISFFFFFFTFYFVLGASLVAQPVKNPPAIQET